MIGRRTFYTRVCCPGAAFALVAGITLIDSPSIEAQQRVAVDTVRGDVIARDSVPIARAHVRVTGEDGVPRQALTDSSGGYSLVVKGSGVYELRVRAFGYMPLTVVVERARDRVSAGSRIERNLQLNPIPITLAGVRVVAAASARVVAAPGDRSAQWLSFLNESLPLDPGDISATAALQPGVTRIGADGTRVSIAGQSPDQNRTTIDGASANSPSLPSEGVRSAGVISNSYDVSRGHFSGGELAATTISGTNLWGGALGITSNASGLQYGGLRGGLSRNTQQLKVSGGAGGPLVRDRLFIYSALDVSRSTSPASGLALLDSSALRQLGVSTDSAHRLLRIAEQVGISFLAPSSIAQRASEFASVLARVDYALTDHTSLMMRLDGRRSRFSGLGSSPLTLSSAENSLEGKDAGVLAKLTSATGYWANELRVYRTTGSVTTGKTQSIPAGQVEVISDPGSGALTPSFLSVGGAPFAANQHHSLLEFADDLGRETESGKHRLHGGLLIQFETVSAMTVANPSGSYVFNSLADLANGNPTSFTRNLAAAAGTVRRQYAATYLSDIWHPANTVWLTYGLRFDGVNYGSRPALLNTVRALAPDARGGIPSELVLSPRVGFRFDVPSRGNWTLDGGIGRFAGTTPLDPLAAAWNETGANRSILTCIGAAAPAPTWREFATDPGTIPSSCTGGPSVYSSVAPSVTLFSPHFHAPQTWRASLGANGTIIATWGVMVDALLVHGTNTRSAVDRNLTRDPVFTLSDENGRPAYVSRSVIEPTTGSIAPSASRLNAALGPVLELGSAGQSWTGEITAGVSGFIRGKTLLSLYYTYARSRFLEGGVPAPGVYDATTAGNPMRLEWTDSPFTPRHAIQVMLSRGIARMRLSAIGRLSSGLPFTPIVGNDINGDGFANDRAFVFDPANAVDTTLGRSMERLRTTSSNDINTCLLRQAGHIAGSGSCHTPWSPALDLRAEIFALGNINSRRLIVTLTAANVTAGLDYWLHGADNLRGWGEYPVPDATLLQVSSFDPVRGAFSYTVNPHFGQQLVAAAPRLPFQLTLQARVTVGSDPRYQPLLNAITAGLGSAREGARAWLAQYVHNVPAAVLELAATDTSVLNLTLTQRAELQLQSDSLRPQFGAAVDALTAAVMERGPVTAIRQARLQQRTELVEWLASVALERTRQILTPVQFSKLPGWLIMPPTPTQLQHPRFTTTAQGEGP